MTKVYLVEYGEYSDKGISSVHTNRDEANAIARNDGSQVLEYELDEPFDENARPYLRPGEYQYLVRMMHDGNRASVIEEFDKTYNEARCLWVNSQWINGRCWARSEGKAIKIINDRRSGWLAAGKPNGVKGDDGWSKWEL